MNKLQYRSSEAPTCWGMVDLPDKYNDYNSSVYGGFAEETYNEALELALKNWIPIRDENQEEINKQCYINQVQTWGNNKTIKHWTPDESKLYDIPSDMEFELDDIMSPRIKINNQTEGAITKQFYALKSKAEEETNEAVICLKDLKKRIFGVDPEYIEEIIDTMIEEYGN